MNTAGGAVINQIVSNIVANPNLNPFRDLNLTAVGTAVGSFLGTKLASAIHSFDTIGGQLGSAIGSSLGTLGATTLLVAGTGSSATLAGLQLGALAGPLGAAFGAFAGFLLGGLIGSVFGGTPRSGADVQWDSTSGSFVVANDYARKGGSRDAAKGMAEAVAGTFNSVLAMTGGALIAPQAVQAGNYGMRKKDYVYRPRSTTDKDAITQRFNGKDGAERLIGYGVYQGLTDPDFQIAGGDVYAKRALYNTFTMGGVDPNHFDSAVLLGNLATAQRYETYLANSTSINALIAAEPDSVFTAEWAIVFARAVELGLVKRHASDWYGGFGLLMEEAGVSAAEVEFGFDYDPFADRVSRLTALGPYVLGDAIDVAGQDSVEGTVGADTIDLSSGQLAAGLSVNGASLAATRAIDVAATVDGGEGDDVIRASDRGDNLIGGAGDDTLIGGRLDDWLIGGEGNDRLFAGRVAHGGVDAAAALAADGGGGNYLDGGDGDDALYGSTGSDWLVGGDGADVLYGGAGGDILNAGAGNDGTAAAPAVQGGGGSDQYIFNRGDGQDVYYDDATGALPGATGDSISRAVRARTAGTLAKNWSGGGEFTIDGSTRGGEDAVSFGAGITMGDIVMTRSGTVTNPGMDLIIRVQTDDVWNPGDDQITVRDWFEGTRRIEWLRFANGEDIRIGDFVSFQIGTAGNDVLVGTNGNDFQYGGDGDDTLFGLAGDDFQVGGKGDDLVSGNDDNDIVLGGNDDDIVLGGLGNDLVSGDDGRDRVYGGGGNDIVVGGRGDDEIVGGAGDDVFRYERGDGRDTMFDEFAGSWEVVWTGDSRSGGYTNGYAVDQYGVVTKGAEVVNDGTKWIGQYDYNEQGGGKTLYRLIEPGPGASRVRNSGLDTLEFGVGIDIQDLAFRQEGSDLRIAILRSGAAAGAFADTVDQIRIVDWFAGAGVGRSIERFQFVNTGAQNAGEMNLMGGTDGDDTIVAAGGVSAWITGGAGDDTITGTALSDILNGSSGTDTLIGGGGVDVLYGGDGDDTLIGGAGADILIGGSGSDTASYAGANGVTVFLDATLGANTGEAAGDTFDSIENLTGSDGNDALYGDAGDNVLDGGRGSDTLYGGAGDDIYQLNADSGTDTIIDRVMAAPVAGGTGGAGGGGGDPDFYPEPDFRTGPNLLLHQLPDGGGPFPPPPSPPPPSPAPTTVEGDAGDDTIEVGTGLSLSDLSFVRVGGDLEVRVAAAAANKLVLRDFYLTPDARIENLVLADGLLARLGNIRLAGEAASAEADLLVGTVGGDTLSGLGGNDVLSGGDGDDTLAGGEGDDVLEGGAGADVLDGGGDTVTAGGTPGPDGNGDLVRYAGSKAGVSVNLATLALSGGDAQGDRIVVQNGVSSIENVMGSAHGDTLIGDGRANMLIGLAGDDVLDGGAGDDVLLGGDGVDAIFGGEGEDNIDAGEGNDVNVRGGGGNDLIAGGGGHDVLYGDAGDDTLDGGSGNDTLFGGDGSDMLGGGEGGDVLYGEAGDDRLSGGSGNDVLIGGAGADTLSGDAGDDVLYGEAGDDTYVFDANSGHDTIVDADGANRIVIAGVTQDQLWLTRAGDALRIGVIGGTATITVNGVFGGSPRSVIREITTAVSSLFLKSAGMDSYAGSLIEAMTNASPVAVTPATIADVPAAVAGLRDALWHAGGKAAPELADMTLATNEDTALGGTLAVVDHDENVAGFGVATQAAHGTVTIDPTTGAWIYNPAANYNGSDSFVLSVTDADNQTAVSTVTVEVAAVNDAPVWGVAPALAVDENAANGTVLATLVATDIDGDPVVYSITTVNSPFQISAAGVLSVRDGARLDSETAQSVGVTVRASDGMADTDTLLVVAVRNVNEAPTITSGTGSSYFTETGLGSKPADAGAVVATIGVADPDGTVPTLEFVSNPNNWFTIDQASRTVRFNPGLNFDFEWARAAGYAIADRDGNGRQEALVADVVVRATDGSLVSGNGLVQVLIEDVNEAPAITSGTIAAQLTETGLGANPADGGALVAKIDVVDPDGTDPILEFVPGSNAAGWFYIDQVAKEIRLNPGVNFDYETFRANGHALSDRDGNGALEALAAEIRVRATDGSLTSGESLIQVFVEDVNERPGNLDLKDSNRFSESVAGSAPHSGQLIARFEATDPDGTTPELVILSGNANNWFSVAPGGHLAFADWGVNFTGDWLRQTLGQHGQDSGFHSDVDGDGLKEIRVARLTLAARDAGGLQSDPFTYDVLIEDVNEAPTDIALAQPANVVEQDHAPRGVAVGGIVVGTLTAADPDLGEAGDTHVYSTADPKFEIVNGNQLFLRTGQALDYETALVEADTGRRYVDVPVTVADRPGREYSLSLTQLKRVYVSDAVDYHYGTIGADTLDGAAGVDEMYGSDGDDALYGRGGDDRLYGEVGDDTLDGGEGDDRLFGGEGDDRILGGAGRDTIYGEDGDDTLLGGAGDDVVLGGAGNDVLYGEDGADVLHGEDGGDTIVAGAGDDTLLGGAGNDTLYGQDGNDTIDGGDDNDSLVGGAGADTLIGGAGIDTAYYSGSTSAVSVNLASGTGVGGEAQGDTLSGIENLVGGSHADTLVGDAGSNWIAGGEGGDWLQGEAGDDGLFGQGGDDTLHGGDGDDQLDGGAGNDTLIGGTGNDVLNGGLGDDLLIGGAGDDRYVFLRGDGDDVVDQMGSTPDDKDIVGFTDVSRDNLWFMSVGDSIRIGVLGGTGLDSSVTLKDFRTASVTQTAQIRVVIARTDATIDLKIGELTTKLDRFAAALGYQVTTQAQFNALLANTTTVIDGLTFRQTWTNYWTSNTPAAIATSVPSIAAAEDQFAALPYDLTFSVTDDYDASNQLLERTVTAVAAAGSTTPMSSLMDVSVTWPSENGGNGTIAVRTRPNASGTGHVWIHTKDTGGLVSDRWVPVSVSAVADAPTVSASSPGGNAGAGIALAISPQLTDTDGSESISRIEIRGVPAGFGLLNDRDSITAGNNRGADGVWRLTPADLAGLRIVPPANWSRDLTGAASLLVRAVSTEASNGSEATSGDIPLAVRINGAPSSFPNQFDYASAFIWSAESRWLGGTTGPDGRVVDVLQTGQLDADNGGGVHSNGFQVDPSKAYKFTVYVRADSPADTLVYFGVAAGGYVENAHTGADDGNPYFMYPAQNTLTVGRWYRMEGYVLPRGAPLVETGAYGGIFDAVTGRKVADATTFRWNDAMPGTLVHSRFFNYYGSAQGFSTSWYDPVASEVPISNSFVDENTAPGAVVGILKVDDPDRIENNLFDLDRSYLLPNEHRWATGVTGPGGDPVTVLQTGQFDTENGGGAISSEFAIDPTKAYKYTVFVRADSVADTRVYFGVQPGSGASVENATTGADDGNPYFMYPVQNTLTVGRWYRFEGYVLPQGAPLVEAGVYGGVFDVETGRKVADANTFRWDAAMAGTTTQARFFDYYGSAQGFSTSWYQPVVEELPTFTQNGTSGFTVDSATGLVRLASSPDYEATANLPLSVTARDSGGLQSTVAFDVAVRNLNEAPTITSGTGSSYFTETGLGAKPADAGAVVATIGVADPDGTVPTLEFVSNPNNWFTIDQASRTVRFNPGLNFDFEWARAAGYAIADRDGNGRQEALVAAAVVRANDGSLVSDNGVIYVLIEDVNEAPTITSGTGWKHFTETGLGSNPANAGVVVATIGVADPDGTVPNLEFVSNPNNWFTIDQATKTIRFNPGLNFDYESFRNAGYGNADWNGNGILEVHVADVWVRATDGSLLSDNGLVQVFIEDVNETPTLSPGYTAAFLKETGTGPANGFAAADAGAVVATLATADPDGTVPTLEFVSNPNNWFYIDQATGTIRLNGGLNFDYEGLRNAGYGNADWSGNGILEVHVADVRVRATDGTLLSNEGLVQVFIEDAPEAPVNLRPDRVLSLPENSQGQYTGGFAWIVADDPEGQPLTYSLVDGLTGSGRFGLRSDGLLYTTGAYTNYEEVQQYTIRVRATDPTGLSVTRDLQVAVTDVNERPNTVVLEAQNVFAETLAGQAAHSGNLIARFTMADPDGPAPGLVILGGNQYGWFTTAYGNHLAFSPGVNFTSDWLRANAAALGIGAGHDSNGNGILEYRVASLTIAAQDAGGLQSDPFTYDVYIEDVNEAPTVAPTTLYVAENMPGAGITSVGSALTWSDPDITPAFRNVTWSLVGGDLGVFSIGRTDGQMRLQQSLNYEARSQYNVIVRATDQGGLYSDQWVTIGVTDANDAPAPTATEMYVDAGGDGRYYAGQIDANDPDAGDTHTLQIINVNHVFGYQTANLYYSVYDDNLYANVSGTRRPPSIGFGNGTYSQDEVTIRVRDSAGAYADVVVTVNVSIDDGGRSFGGFQSPIAIDLDGDGVELVSLATSKVTFDIDNDGLLDRTGWIGADDGWLALDRNGDGRITQGTEISFRSDLFGARSDLEGLRAFDTDKNGVFDAGDRQFSDFRIWQDKNLDGVSQDRELSTLAERGITAIRLELDETGDTVEGATDNVVFATSEFYRGNGTTGDVGDIFVAFESGVDGDVEGKLKTDRTVKFAGVGDTHPLPGEQGKGGGDEKGTSTTGSSGNDNLGPIVIDLDGDGVELTSFVNSTVRFDMDNDGLRERTGWAGADDGLLAFDWNGDGRIDDASEISFKSLILGAQSDLEGLAAFDDTGDGRIDADDAAYDHLAVWRDANQDGITDAGELRSLKAAGLTSISLASVKTGRQPGKEENVVFARTTASLADGSATAVEDVFFTFETAPDAAGEPVPAAGGDGKGEVATPPTPAADAAEPVAVASRTMGRRFKDFRIHADGGYPVIRRTKAKGTIAPDAGQLGAATILSFTNKTIGLLSTIILDLDGDGVETKRWGKTRAGFDMDGNGGSDDTGWVSGGDGFLVADIDRDGRIEGPGELSLLGLSTKAQGSRDALAALDSNRDRVVDARDERFDVLKVWVDANANGRTDAGELRSLGDLGIASFNLAARATGRSSKLDTNLVTATATFARTDGSLGTMGDTLITFKPGAAAPIARAPRLGDLKRVGPALDTGQDVLGHHQRSPDVRLDGFDSRLDALDLANFGTDRPSAMSTPEQRSEGRDWIEVVDDSDAIMGAGGAGRPTAPEQGQGARDWVEVVGDSDAVMATQPTVPLNPVSPFVEPYAGTAADPAGGAGQPFSPDRGRDVDALAKAGVEPGDRDRSAARERPATLAGDERAATRPDEAAAPNPAATGREDDPAVVDTAEVDVRGRGVEVSVVDSARAAAELLRRPPALSLNVSDGLADSRRRLGAGNDNDLAAAGPTGANLDKLIAAMAAFQGAEGMGAMGLSGTTPIETAMAQLAPAA